MAEVLRRTADCEVRVYSDPTGGGTQRGQAGVIVGQPGRNSFQHPGPAEIQPVEMHELAVCCVAHDRRLQPVWSTVLRNIGQEHREPAGKLIRGHHAA